MSVGGGVWLFFSGFCSSDKALLVLSAAVFSPRFVWHGSLSQATQRAVLQWSPVTGQVTFANVLDLLHDAGLDAELLEQEQIPPPLDVDEAGLPYETIAANRLSWLDARPAISRRCRERRHGGGRGDAASRHGRVRRGRRDAHLDHEFPHGESSGRQLPERWDLLIGRRE